MDLSEADEVLHHELIQHYLLVVSSELQTGIFSNLSFECIYCGPWIYVKARSHARCGGVLYACQNVQFFLSGPLTEIRIGGWASINEDFKANILVRIRKF